MGETFLKASWSLAELCGHSPISFQVLCCFVDGTKRRGWGHGNSNRGCSSDRSYPPCEQCSILGHQHEHCLAKNGKPAELVDLSFANPSPNSSFNMTVTEEENDSWMKFDNDKSVGHHEIHVIASYSSTTTLLASHPAGIFDRGHPPICYFCIPCVLSYLVFPIYLLFLGLSSMFSSEKKHD